MFYTRFTALAWLARWEVTLYILKYFSFFLKIRPLILRCRFGPNIWVVLRRASLSLKYSRMLARYCGKNNCLQFQAPGLHTRSKRNIPAGRLMSVRLNKTQIDKVRLGPAPGSITTHKSLCFRLPRISLASFMTTLM